MKTRVEVLKSGDKVINVTAEFIAVKRKNGEVEIIPLLREGVFFRVDTENTMIIGYGKANVTTVTEEGITIINF